MLLSEASDVWELNALGQGAVTPGSDPTNAFQEERKSTYYVLRNAGYRVDLVTEADVRDSYLKRYKALYVGGENMERATAKVIAKWVEEGGVLYASAGAARKDEYDEAQTELDKVLGRAERVAYKRFKGPLRAKLELPFLKPIDTVTLASGAKVDALATTETFKSQPGAEVVAKFGDGSPAVVKNSVGKGKAYYAAFFPAQPWAQKGLPPLPCGKGGPENETHYPQIEPVEFNADASSVILAPLAENGIGSDAKFDKPGVVCNLLAGPKGSVVTVVNLHGARKGPAKDASLTLTGLKSVGKVWSYAYPKGLKHDLKDGVLTVQMPDIDLVDVVVVETK
jgi:hypothetical protein